METIFVVVEQDGVFDVKGAFNSEVESEEVNVTVFEEGKTWSSIKTTTCPIIEVPIFGFVKVKAVVVEDADLASKVLDMTLLDIMER